MSISDVSLIACSDVVIERVIVFVSSASLTCFSSTCKYIRSVVARERVSPLYWKRKLERVLRVGELPFTAPMHALRYWRDIYHEATTKSPKRLYMNMKYEMVWIALHRGCNTKLRPTQYDMLTSSNMDLRTLKLIVSADENFKRYITLDSVIFHNAMEEEDDELVKFLIDICTPSSEKASNPDEEEEEEYVPCLSVSVQTGRTDYMDLMIEKDPRYFERLDPSQLFGCVLGVNGDKQLRLRMMQYFYTTKKFRLPEEGVVPTNITIPELEYLASMGVRIVGMEGSLKVKHKPVMEILYNSDMCSGSVRSRILRVYNSDLKFVGKLLALRTPDPEYGDHISYLESFRLLVDACNPTRHQLLQCLEPCLLSQYIDTFHYICSYIRITAAELEDVVFATETFVDDSVHAVREVMMATGGEQAWLRVAMCIAFRSEPEGLEALEMCGYSMIGIEYELLCRAFLNGCGGTQTRDYIAKKHKHWGRFVPLEPGAKVTSSHRAHEKKGIFTVRYIEYSDVLLDSRR